MASMLIVLWPQVRRRMAEIKAKVQNGGMGSWDMGRVKNQLNKLSQRVAALERCVCHPSSSAFLPIT